MTNTDLEMFISKLQWLIYENDNPFIEKRKPVIQMLFDELGYFRDKTIDEEDAGNNWNRRLMEAVHQAEDIVDMFLSCAIMNPYNNNNNYNNNFFIWSRMDLMVVMADLKSIRQEMSISYNDKGNLFQKQDMIMMMDNKSEATGSSGNIRLNVSAAATEHEELIVGFDDDALLIKDRLTGHRKKLDVLSIVGMGGLGKTTLATKIFNDSLVEYHFDIRGWVTVSQAYSRQDLLLQLLASIGKLVPEAVTESKLCEMLYQSLKRIKYLIVIDDIWSCKVWDEVRQWFPDDNNGSRVVVTTRLSEVAWHASQGGFTHNLGHLNKDQSWELLCRKTFRGYACPESLIETGKQIAKKCGGLPLALVVIAGLLEKGEKRKDLREKVAESVVSYFIHDPKGCLDTLGLSYDHLPSHLKKCFLYVGGFPEDYKIQVQRLIRLWMAEGFVKEAGQRSLEEEDEHYLMELIGRNLLIIAGKSSNGGVKSCRLHDLLRELCLKKADEENFFKKVSRPTSNITLDSNSVSSIVKQGRLFTDYEVLSEIYWHHVATHTRSVLCVQDTPLLTYSTTIWARSFLLLRVLDLQHVHIVDLSNIRILVHLSYLAVWSYNDELSLSKANLRNLQTLIVTGILHSFICDSMVNLRHLRYAMINMPINFSGTTLFNLQTISRLRLDHRTQFLLESFPNIKKLGCCISSTSSNHELFSFSMLTHLESLSIHRYGLESATLANPIRFPETLRKLTLTGLCLPWNYMSTIQRLPKLEVLKLLGSSFKGHQWETGDEQFRELKFLKLENLDIRFWEASSINFPCLRTLAVRSCRDLSKIPLALGNISTLECIKIESSNPHLRNSVYRIQKVQREMDNGDFHVSVTHMESGLGLKRNIFNFTHVAPSASGVFFKGNPFYD